MPFIAARDSERVIPEEVSDGISLSCISCGEEMRARGPFRDGTARHFYHCRTGKRAGSGGCTVAGGESDTHRKLKSIAVSALRQEFDYKECGPEVMLDVSGTESEADIRRADALVEFNSENRFYGNGIIIEVQYQNRGKNIRATTHDYLSLGYSVYWATPDDFSRNQFEVDEMLESFEDESDSAFAVYTTSPPVLQHPSPIIESEEQTAYTTTDIVPECEHIFARKNSLIRHCVRCDLEARKCRYDESTSQIRPVDENQTGPNTFHAYIKDSISRPVSVRDIRRGGTPVDHQHAWKLGNQRIYSDPKDTAYVCRITGCDSRLIVQGEIVKIREKESKSDQSRMLPSDAETLFDGESSVFWR